MGRLDRKARTDARSARDDPADAQSQLRQAFRVSAVRLPVLDHTKADEVATPLRVSDEELVHTLWAKRAQFEKRLVEEANGEANKEANGEANKRLANLRIDSVELQAVEPAQSVLVRLVFVVGASKGAAQSVTGFAKVPARIADLSAKGIVKVAELFGKAFGTHDVPVSASPEPIAVFSAAVIVSVAALLEEAPGTRVAVSASAEPSPAKGPAADATTTSWDRLTPFLAAIATGVGVLGFVTFVGGMIVWARVRAAGLPPAPTLGVLPNQDLLVIGAETLVPTVLTALGVVVVLTVAYAFVRWALKQTEFRHRLTDYEEAFLAGEAGLLAAAGMFGFVFLALGLTLTLRYEDLPPGQFTLGIAGVAVGAVLAGMVGSITRRFLYLAMTAFVLAGAYVGLVAYWRAGNEENIRGAAIIRQNQQAIYGVFVAEGAGRVYLARFATGKDGKIDRSNSRLVGIAKSQVTDIAIGDRKPPTKALAQALQLAEELCGLQPKPAPPPSSGQIEDCVTRLPAEHQR